MFKLPSAYQPSSFAPSSTYDVSNAVIKGVRVAFGRKRAIRIKFDDSDTPDRRLAEWCECHSHTYVQSLQLRKERRAPFFHEYIAFMLDTGESFRMDRRQLPNEGSPLDCKENGGVEAYETLEQIQNMEDSLYNASDCLVQVDFQESVRPELIIDICREIAQHELSYVYTVQRYNCYFYAQTILLCTLCRQYGWYEDYVWGSGNVLRVCDTEEVVTDEIPLARLGKNSTIRIRVLEKQLQDHFTPENDPTPYTPEMLNMNKLRARNAPFRMALPQRKGSRAIFMKDVSIGELQAYLSDLIRAHSLRVEHYKLLLKCTAFEVEQDIKKAVNRIWKNRRLYLGQVAEMKTRPQADMNLYCPTVRRPRKNTTGTEEWDLDKIGKVYEDGLRRRPRVKPRKGRSIG